MRTHMLLLVFGMVGFLIGLMGYCTHQIIKRSLPGMAVFTRLPGMSKVVLFFMTIAAVGGCIYDVKSVGMLADYVEDRDGGIVVDVDVKHHISCVYPPDFMLTRDVLGVENDAMQMVWEPVLRLPTMPLELLFNAWAYDTFKIKSAGSVHVSKELMGGTSFCPDSCGNVSEVVFPNGKKIKLPFCVGKKPNGRDEDNDGPVMDVIYGDANGWLWFAESVGHKRFCGIDYSPSPNNPCKDTVLCKVSSKTGEVVPIMLRGMSNQVYLAPGQTDFVELKEEHKRRFVFFRGLSRFFMQSHL